MELTIKIAGSQETFSGGKFATIHVRVLTNTFPVLSPAPQIRNCVNFGFEVEAGEPGSRRGVSCVWAIHPQATLAAEAARCAGAQDTGQGAYVAMHNALFERQKAWSGRANAADLFVDYAAEIGLDSESFATCLENHDFEAAV